MNFSFENQIALVTGAASGIGLATAQALAQAGATVALIDVDENALRSAVEELVSAARKALAIRCYVSEEDAVAAIIQQTISTFGQLNMAFNNARVHGARGAPILRWW
jgi:NAD(P)-dependent dehydrogenase (short-subunit alcohol dehydrogenase family)